PSRGGVRGETPAEAGYDIAANGVGEWERSQRRQRPDADKNGRSRHDAPHAVAPGLKGSHRESFAGPCRILPRSIIPGVCQAFASCTLVWVPSAQRSRRRSRGGRDSKSSAASTTIRQKSAATSATFQVYRAESASASNV